MRLADRTALTQAVAPPGAAVPSVMATRLMLNRREHYWANGSMTVETRSHEMQFYHSAQRRKTGEHTTYDTAWALDSGKVIPVLSLTSLNVFADTLIPGLPDHSQR